MFVYLLYALILFIQLNVSFDFHGNFFPLIYWMLFYQISLMFSPFRCLDFFPLIHKVFFRIYIWIVFTLLLYVSWLVSLHQFFPLKYVSFNRFHFSFLISQKILWFLFWEILLFQFHCFCSLPPRHLGYTQ